MSVVKQQHTLKLHLFQNKTIGLDLSCIITIQSKAYFYTKFTMEIKYFLKISKITPAKTELSRRRKLIRRITVNRGNNKCKTKRYIGQRLLSPCRLHIYSLATFSNNYNYGDLGTGRQ